MVYHHIAESGIIPDLFLFCPEIIFLDEVNLANKKQLEKTADLSAKAGIILIIGTHNDLTDYLPQYVQIDTFQLKTLLPKRLSNILQSSLNFSSRENNRYRFSENAADELLKISKGCMEKIRSICYDIFLQKEIPPVIDENIIKTTASKLRETHVDYSEAGKTSGPDFLSI